MFSELERLCALQAIGFLENQITKAVRDKASATPQRSDIMMAPKSPSHFSRQSPSQATGICAMVEEHAMEPEDFS
jgi:hypothetical protein